MMRHWAGLHMARGHCIVCPCPCSNDGCDTIAVTSELIAKHCLRKHEASFPKGDKGQAKARGIVEKYLHKWYLFHGEKGTDRCKALSVPNHTMHILINDHYRWQGPSSCEPSAKALVERALEVGHPNTKCSIKIVGDSLTRRATEAAKLAQKQLSYPSTVIGRGLKPKIGSTGAKTVNPTAGTSYSDKLKGSGNAQCSGKGSESGDYDGTKPKTYMSPSGEPLSLHELQMKLPKLQNVTSQVQSLGKIRRRPGLKSKQKFRSIGSGSFDECLYERS